MNTTRYLITIKAEDRPGLLHQITGMINRKQIDILSLTAAATDIHDILLITAEVRISEKALLPLKLKLENIVEVFSVAAAQFDEVICLRSAFFLMNKAALSSPLVSAITKYEAQIVNLRADTVLIGKSGSEAVIRQLYNALDGAHLLGFSQTGLIADSNLISHEDNDRVDVGRITGLAA